MPSNDLLSSTADHVAETWPLAIVPLVVSLLDRTRLQTLLANTDRVFSVTFGLPRPVSSLWSFITATQEGISGGPPAPEMLPQFTVVLLATAIVSGLLAAGYLGGLNSALTGRLDFFGSVRAYGVPFVVLSVAEALVGLLFFAVGFTSTPLLLVVAVVLFSLAYLFFTTPYLLVVEELSLVDALRASYTYATSDGTVPVFFIGYLLVSAVVSVPVSVVAFSEPPLGIVAALLVSAPLALAFNVATLLFVRDLTGTPPANQASSSNIPVDM